MSRIGWARAALQFTTTELLIGASNQTRRDKATGGLATQYVRRQRQVDGAWERGAGGGWQFVPSGVTYRAQGATAHDRILDLAARASEYRAGNCGENAAVAYRFVHQALVEGRITEPIGRVSYCMCREPGDHAFVVIAEADDRVPHLRSPGTVICDPWGGVVMTGSQLDARAGTALLKVRKSDISVRRLQCYILRHGATVISSFRA